MYAKIQSLLKIRGVRIAVEICLILLVYIVLKSWIQRSMIDGPAPDIQARLLDGRPFALQQLHGKPALLHFWASWCGICKLEQDSIEAISKGHAVISIAMTSGSLDEVRQYMHDNKLSFPVINDPDGAISRTYGIRAVPASFILNAKGEISFKETGYTSNWGLRLRLWFAAQ